MQSKQSWVHNGRGLARTPDSLLLAIKDTTRKRVRIGKLLLASWPLCGGEGGALSRAI